MRIRVFVSARVNRGKTLKEERLIELQGNSGNEKWHSTDGVLWWRQQQRLKTGNTTILGTDPFKNNDVYGNQSSNFANNMFNLYRFAANDPINGWDFIGLLTATGGVPTTDPWPIVGEHGNYLTFTVSCPAGSEFQLDSIDYSGAVQPLSQIFGSSSVTSIAGPIPPAEGLGGLDNEISPNPGGVNCDGDPTTIEVFMRSRFSTWWLAGFNASQGVAAYANHVVINYHCEICCFIGPVILP